MAKVLISPSKYLQGAGEMKNIGTYAANCGKKALVLISKGGYKRIGKMIEDRLLQATAMWFLIILTESAAIARLTVW